MRNVLIWFLLCQTAPQFSVRTDTVLLPTRVQDKKGNTIYGLTADQFIIEDNGVRQAVHIEEDPGAIGLSLVVAIQCGRMAELEFKKLKGLGAMIDAIVGDAPHEVAVVSYGVGPYVLGNFSEDSDATRKALSKLHDCSSNGAATIDAVYYSISMLKRRQNHYRRAILLISETRDHGSHSKLEDVVAELGVSDTVIYPVSFSPLRDEALHDLRHANDAYNVPPMKKSAPPPDVPKPETPADSRWTEKRPLIAWPPELLMIVNALRGNTASELASLSGGEYVNFTTQKGFDASLERISNRIHNFYVLSFKAQTEPDWRMHTLKVRVADHPEAVIQTRKNYWSGILESTPPNRP